MAVTNNLFMLSDKQLAAYTEWAQQRAEEHAAADALESLEISVTFTFSPYGREIVARVGSTGPRLVLQEIA